MTEVAHVVSQNLVALAGLQIANYRKYRQKSGSNFNVFKILRRTTDEVNGHSSFIAELLNPLGGHGLGDVFLKRFFTTLGISQDIEGLSHWEVFVEEGKDVDGRMDILVVGHDDAGRKIGIAIENKIYAGDQPKQLSRYWAYLNDKFGRYRKGDDVSGPPYYLYYLTLMGDTPSKQSIEGIPQSEVQWLSDKNGEAPVRLLSYSFQILEWLKVCHEKLAPYPYSREVMSQYIDTVNSLTGNGGGMVDELKCLLDTPDKLYAAAKLVDAVAKFKQELLASLWEMLKAEWKVRADSPESLLRGGLVANRYADKDEKKVIVKSREYFSKQREVPRYFGFAACSYGYKGLPVALEIRFNNCFYVGLYGGDEEKILEKSVVEKFYSIYQAPKGCTLSSVEEKSQKQRIVVNTPIRFDTDNEEMFKLIEHKSKKKLVSIILDVAEGIVQEMSKHGLEPLENQL
jgi:hypothetical protein